MGNLNKERVYGGALFWTTLDSFWVERKNYISRVKKNRNNAHGREYVHIIHVGFDFKTFLA